MKKEQRITAHVTVETKEEIVKRAKKEERSESFIAGKLLDEQSSPNKQLNQVIKFN